MILICARASELPLTLTLLGCVSSENLGARGGGSSTSSPLDGTWDITGYKDPIEPSSVTIRDGVLDGKVVVANDGKPIDESDGSGVLSRAMRLEPRSEQDAAPMLLPGDIFAVPTLPLVARRMHEAQPLLSPQCRRARCPRGC